MAKIKDYKDYKSWVTIASFVIVLLAYGAKFVLMSDQVKRNATAIKDAELIVVNHRLTEIEKKIDKIVDYIMEQ